MSKKYHIIQVMQDGSERLMIKELIRLSAEKKVRELKVKYPGLKIVIKEGE